MSNKDFKVVDGDLQNGEPLPRERRVLFIAMIGGIIAAGAGFVYKIAEFIYTISDEAARGFADVPVLTYFCVAAGWFLLLSWCFLTGKFNNHSVAKFEMLAQEEEYERLGI